MVPKIMSSFNLIAAIIFQKQNPTHVYVYEMHEKNGILSKLSNIRRISMLIGNNLLNKCIYRLWCVIIQNADFGEILNSEKKGDLSYHFM